MRTSFAVLLALAALSAVPGRAQQPTDGQQQFADLGVCKLTNGQQITNCDLKLIHGTLLTGQVLDEDNKPYSNAPVHIDVLMSNPSVGATYPAGSSFVIPFGTGAQAPGLFYSEIYVPKNHIMYYNVVRNDSGFAGQVAVNLPFQFNGSKVYAR